MKQMFAEFLEQNFFSNYVQSQCEIKFSKLYNNHFFKVPFPKERDITRSELRFKPAIPVARHIKEFIRWLLNPDERTRPDFNGIQQHPWIKEGRERAERNSTGL